MWSVSDGIFEGLGMGSPIARLRFAETPQTLPAPTRLESHDVGVTRRCDT